MGAGNSGPKWINSTLVTYSGEHVHAPAIERRRLIGLQAGRAWRLAYVLFYFISLQTNLALGGRVRGVGPAGAQRAAAVEVLSGTEVLDESGAVDRGVGVDLGVVGARMGHQQWGTRGEIREGPQPKHDGEAGVPWHPCAVVSKVVFWGFVGKRETREADRERDKERVL